MSDEELAKYWATESGKYLVVPSLTGVFGLLGSLAWSPLAKCPAGTPSDAFNQGICTKQAQVLGATFTSAVQMGVALAFAALVISCLGLVVMHNKAS